MLHLTKPKGLLLIALAVLLAAGCEGLDAEVSAGQTNDGFNVSGKVSRAKPIPTVHMWDGTEATANELIDKAFNALENPEDYAEAGVDPFHVMDQVSHVLNKYLELKEQLIASAAGNPVLAGGDDANAEHDQGGGKSDAPGP